ncbi:MAG: DoxX family membrane protein [Halobacterium sp.]
MTRRNPAVREYAGALAARAPAPATLARWGLGLMLVAAGAHKLLEPGAWTVYVTDWLAPWLVVSPRAFVLANGWLELGFAVLLLADRWTAFAALVAAVSLSATTGYLAVVWAATGQFGDVAARDVGLTGLAVAVLVDALREA